jgi:hypothetical protein
VVLEVLLLSTAAADRLPEVELQLLDPPVSSASVLVWGRYIVLSACE